MTDEFRYTIAKGGRVLIEWRGRVVTVVSGKAGRTLADRLDQADPERRQLLLARATGNFKRGNERE